jgi:ferredoxin, 2Fe-2S
MPRITFIEHNGAVHVVESEEGQSLMQAAVGNLVPGVTADCGGAGTCATCHGYIDESWAGRVPPPSPDERDMIESGCLHIRENSRLTCQVRVTAQLDGIVIRLPPSQM